MTTNSYITAWLIYLFAAGVISFAAWRMTRLWPVVAQYLLRVVLLTLLFTPYYSDPQQHKFAPAILVCLFELVFGDSATGLKAGVPLLVLLIVSIVAVLFHVLSRRPKKPLA